MGRSRGPIGLCELCDVAKIGAVMCLLDKTLIRRQSRAGDKGKPIVLFFARKRAQTGAKANRFICWGLGICVMGRGVGIGPFCCSLKGGIFRGGWDEVE